MSEVKVTVDNFEAEVVNSDKPVLVDFWATWCGPCQMIAPVVAEIAEEFQGIKVGKINIDEEMELAQKFKVVSIPTLIYFENGVEAKRIIGFNTKAEIVETLNLK